MLQQSFSYLNEANYNMLETISNVKGIEKSYIINQALEYYFNLLKTIPEEFAIKPIYIDDKEFERLEENSKITKDLMELLNDN